MDLGDFLNGVPFIALKGFRGGYYFFEASETLIKDYDDLMKQDDIYKSIIVGSLYYSDINHIVTKFGDITQNQDDQLNINAYILGKLITIPIDQKMIDSFINGDIIDDHIIKN
ncbi:MAG: hypothetical protein Unbinned2903contig1001_3 [Prokaryotic dsDNA virus sp.]|nr:MAG: hypothetical protein Unbinned2903contig1001_3 [Prokaryotic dsDNA virus sp.]